jgi:hypothetical protein
LTERGRSSDFLVEPPVVVAQAILEGEPCVTRVRVQRGLRKRELMLMFFPLSNLSGDQTRIDGQAWQVFCPDTGSGLITQLPWSGSDVARRLGLAGDDQRRAEQALIAIMVELMIARGFSGSRSEPLRRGVRAVR